MVLIAGLVEAVPLLENPYTELRCRLLAAHQLTDIQWVEQLFNLPLLASQKPSELLNEMLAPLPRGTGEQRLLPQFVSQQVAQGTPWLLIKADIANKHALCTRAGFFAAHNSKMSHDVGAAGPPFLSRIVRERENSTAVAAVHPGAGSSQRGSGSGQQGGASQPGSMKPRRGSGSGQQVTYTVSHTEWDQSSACPANMLIDPFGQALLESTGRRGVAWFGAAQPAHSHSGGRLCAAVLSNPSGFLSGPRRCTSHRRSSSVFSPHRRTSPHAR